MSKREWKDPGAAACDYVASGSSTKTISACPSSKCISRSRLPRSPDAIPNPARLVLIRSNFHALSRPDPFMQTHWRVRDRLRCSHAWPTRLVNGCFCLVTTPNSVSPDRKPNDAERSRRGVRLSGERNASAHETSVRARLQSGRRSPLPLSS